MRRLELKPIHRVQTESRVETNYTLIGRQWIKMHLTSYQGSVLANNSGKVIARRQLFSFVGNLITSAVHYVWLAPSALKIRKPHWTKERTVKFSHENCLCSSLVTKLPAHYHGVVHIPIISTDYSPDSWVQQFYPASIWYWGTLKANRNI